MDYDEVTGDESESEDVEHYSPEKERISSATIDKTLHDIDDVKSRKKRKRVKGEVERALTMRHLMKKRKKYKKAKKLIGKLSKRLEEQKGLNAEALDFIREQFGEFTD